MAASAISSADFLLRRQLDGFYSPASGDSPVRLQVHLPSDLLALLGSSLDLLEAAARVVRKDLEDASLAHSLGDGDLALGVAEAVTRRRGNVHGNAGLDAEDLGLGGSVTDAAHDAGTEEDAGERGGVLGESWD